MKTYSKWILAAATVVAVQGAYARESWGPPSACPKPKVDCCPKPKCEEPCKPKCEPVCKPVKKAPVKQCPKAECCPKPCEPCPPVCFERGLPTTACCTPAAYSESAAIDLRCSADVFITGNFIYWQVAQGGMDLAIPGQVAALSPLGTVTTSANGAAVLFQDFDYEPGFQVGLGWTGAKDNWTLFAEYTWLHNSTSTSANAPTPTSGFGLWIPTDWFPSYSTNNVATEVSSKWKYGIDLIDLQISRPFYSGTRFIVEPSLGLRGTIITQSLKMTVNDFSGGGYTAATPTRNASYRSHNWSIGPRVGAKGNWHLGYGIRIIGDADFSLAYTRFTSVKQNVDTPATSLNAYKMKITDYGVVLPNADLSLGLGWGSYFGCRRYYFDVAATYDFRIFWEQNMMRYIADLGTDFASPHIGAAAGNLYLQGLTVKLKFEF